MMPTCISATSVRDPAHNSIAPSTSWSLHSRPILLCDSDGTSLSLLSSISLPIPFPDYSSTTTPSTPLTSCFTTDYILPQSSNLLVARADSFESQTRQNLVIVVALVHPPGRLSLTTSTSDISPFEVTVPATFIKSCNCSFFPS